ncbi:MAG: CRISPR-associated RAMP protein [Leptolyngbyaceae cyanobacterium CSU_1_3]|nr:CRISPR-associated RAMP protein [Leptolyngbyaceae cyanobacterium CSU_1_3]
MFDRFRNRLEIKGTLTTVTALRVSAGRSSEPIGSDLPVIKDALRRPLIPGASLKGALRSRLESFLRGIDPTFATDPTELVEQIDQIQSLKKDENKKDSILTQEILRETDLVSRLFGAPWLAGKLQIRDLTVEPDAWFGQYQERNGVAIERDTETAANGKLYDFQVVPADTPFQFHAVIENAESWELGLLLVGLEQLKTQQLALGGGRSRGLGVVELVLEKMSWIDVRQGEKLEDIDREKLLEYVKQLANHQAAREDILHNAEIQAAWSKALISKLNNELGNHDA